MSSSKRLMEWIDEEEGVPVEEVVKLSEEDNTYAQTQFGVQGCSESVSSEKKILGFNWNIERDTFVFQFDWLMEFARELPLNQRTVLKVVAKLYETILRIKLLASSIPSRLIIPESVQPYFKIKINEIFCWTDSTTTLHWIKWVDKENKQFVENRVEEIRQNEPPEAWNHCLGTQNPVDLPSRGMGSDALKQSQLWWHGPFELVKERNIWPYVGNSHEPSDYRMLRFHSRPSSQFPTNQITT